MIDINKTYMFEDSEGQVLSTVAAKPYSVVWMSVEGIVWVFTSDGRRYAGGTVKLIEVKPTRWINAYQKGVCGPYKSLEIANRYAGPNRIACIEFKEGDGL